MRTLLVLLAVAALATPASAAAPCYTTSVTDARELVIDEPAPLVYGTGHAYLVIDLCEPVVGDGSCTFSMFYYEESNGLPGLQREDIAKNDVAGCADGTESDSLPLF